MKYNKIKDVDFTEVKPVEPTVDPVVDPEVDPEVDPVVDPVVDPEVQNNEPAVDPEVQNNEPVVDPEVINSNIPDPTNCVEGVVVKCAKLNVREEPSKDANVVQIIDKKTKVMVNLEQSTDDFYYVYSLELDGFEGYCVKEFLQVK